MTTYHLNNKTTSEALTFTCGNDDTFSPFWKVEELMYVYWEMTPCDITSRWARKSTKTKVLWTYHGFEFAEMTYDRKTHTFTVKDVVA